jgi:transposase
LLLTEGQAHDMRRAHDLLDGQRATAVIADRAYDATSLIEAIEAMGAVAVIPPLSTRANQRTYDRHLYKERHLVENCIARLKQRRRVATRYEKTAASFLGMLHIAAIIVWLA